MGVHTEKHLVPEMGEDQRAWDVQMEFGMIDAADAGAFEPLLLPQAVEALQRGEPLTVMGIMQEDTACGALAGYVSDGCFHLISLYVAPDYRRQGGARRMLRELETLLWDEPDIGAMEVTFTTAEADNETLLPFLEALQFLQEDDGGKNIYTFTLGQLKSVKQPKAVNEKDGRVRAFSQLSEDLLRAAQKRSVALGTPQPEQTLTSPHLERELSYAVVKNGRIEAYAAVDHSCCGALTLCALWIGDTNRMLLNTLLKTVIARAQETYPPQTMVAMQTVNDQSLRLLQRLAPDARKVSYTYRRTF